MVDWEEFSSHLMMSQGRRLAFNKEKEFGAGGYQYVKLPPFRDYEAEKEARATAASFLSKTGKP